MLDGKQFLQFKNIDIHINDHTCHGNDQNVS